jgi:hypothetical protein
MIDDLKKQEGVDCVRGLRTGRDQPNSCAAFCFREFVPNLFLEPGHRRGAWRVRVVNEHGCLEISGSKHLGDVSKVRADLLDAGLVVRVFYRDGEDRP